MRIVKSLFFWSMALSGALAAPAQAGSMIDLLNLAFQGNPSLRSQAQLVQASQAEIKGANWQFFPTPSVSVEQVNAANNDTSYNSKDGRVLTLRLQQPLWTGGRLTAGVGRAEAAAAAAQAQFEETRQQLALRTIQAWGEWKAGQQKLVALQGSVQTHQRLLDLIRRRIEGGVSALADDVLAQGRLEQTQADATAAQSQLAAALAKLESLTGQRVLDEQVNGYSVSAVEPLGQLAALLDRAWVNSPTAMKLRAQVRQQELDVEIRKAQLLPEVYARAEHQQGSFTTFGPSSANRFFIGLSATPGAGLSALSGVDAAVARLQSLQAELDSTQRSLIEQVSLEHVSATTQSQRRISLRAGLASTQAMVDSWDRQFLAGRKTWVEVMNAARELAQAQTALAEVEVGYVVATWRLAVLAEGVPAIVSGLGAPVQSAPPMSVTR